MFLSESISVFSITITIIVIICMALAFSLMFWIYSKTKCRVIELGGEDEKLSELIQKELTSYKLKNNVDTSLKGFIEYKRKRNHLYKIITNVIYGLVILFILILSCIALAFRVQGQIFYFGKTTYLNIQTGSMSEKNPAHEDFNVLPNDQIEQYALIGIKKVLEEDISLYDIIAFKHEGIIYVHRVVEILEANGKRVFTTQGDANTGSYSFEVDIPYEKVIGKYNGYQSVALGVFLNYIQSETGIIALTFAMMLLIVIDISEVFVTKSYKKRIDFLLQNLFISEGGKEND